MACLVSVPAHAVDALDPLNLEYRYRISWNGIGIGRLILTMRESNGRYTMTVDTKTRGIVDMFAPLRSVIQTNGRISESGAYIPTSYMSKSHSSDALRSVKLSYNAQGELADRLREPMDDPSWRPEVPLSELSGVPDPLTGFLRFRKEFFNNLKAKTEETALPVYDGRRKAELRVKAINPANRMINDALIPVINSVIFRTPLNGYTPKELAKWEEGDPTIHIYFTQDAELLPLEVSIHLRFGSISVTREIAE